MIQARTVTNDMQDPTSPALVTRETGCDPPAAGRVIPGVPVSDRELVLGARAGDLAAFALLIGRHRDRFLRYAWSLLGNREDAEEAVQDALVRVHRALGQSDPDRFGAWAFRILVNRCRTKARRGRWWKKIARSEGPDTVVGVVDPAPESAAWREEIDRALETLPSDQREAFVLKYVEDLSYAEMTELTGASVSALKMRVSRACDRLRRELEPAR